MAQNNKTTTLVFLAVFVVLFITAAVRSSSSHSPEVVNQEEASIIVDLKLWAYNNRANYVDEDGISRYNPWCIDEKLYKNRKKLLKMNKRLKRLANIDNPDQETLKKMTRILNGMFRLSDKYAKQCMNVPLKD